MNYPESEDLFAKYLLKAAELGNSEAMYCLAVCYERGLRGFQVNHTKAFAWYLESASKNYHPASLEVARIFTVGAIDGSVQANPKAAQEFLSRIPKEQLAECRQIQQRIADWLNSQQ